MPVHVTDDKTKALEFFKDWSNYLLVTTVAALGWVAGAETKAATWLIPVLKPYCIWFLAGSIIFGIFTLALVPLVQEQRGQHKNHQVRTKFWMFPKRGLYLMWVCFPQHVLFIAGVIAYAAGTAGVPRIM